jgi:Family of unknown function (DUF6309)
MKILGPQSYSDLMKIFDAQNVFKDSRCGACKDTWARGRFEDANREFGKWSEVELSYADILEVKLIWNQEVSQGVKHDLIPQDGRTVAEALRLEGVRKWLEKKETFPESHIWLATEPLKATSAIEYARLRDYAGRLVPLDGLHRLLAWAEARKQSTLAFVAGM